MDIWKNVKPATDEQPLKYLGCAVQILGFLLFFAFAGNNILLGLVVASLCIGGGAVYMHWWTTKTLAGQQRAEQHQTDARQAVLKVLEPQLKDAAQSFAQAHHRPDSPLPAARSDGSFIDCWLDDDQLCLLTNWDSLAVRLASEPPDKLSSVCSTQQWETYVFQLALPISAICFYRQEDTPSPSLLLYLYDSSDEHHPTELRLSSSSLTAIQALIPQLDYHSISRQSSSDPKTRLRQLEELRAEHLISEEEYQEKRKKLIHTL